MRKNDSVDNERPVWLREAGTGTETSVVECAAYFISVAGGARKVGSRTDLFYYARTRIIGLNLPKRIN